MFQSALRFAVLPDVLLAVRGRVRHQFQSALRFAVLPDTKRSKYSFRGSQFQSALRFAVLPNPHGYQRILGQVSIRFKVRGASKPYPMTRRPDKPRCSVFTHPPPHPFQPGDRTCPKWDKTPSQVPYTPEVVFGRSPTPLSGGVSKTPSRQPGAPDSSNPTPTPSHPVTGP